MHIDHLTRSIEQRINSAYGHGNNRLGWTMFYSSKSSLLSASITFLGLNPGGGEEGACQMFTGSGCAYENESWRGHPPGEAPLQQQIIKLFSHFGQTPREGICGNFTPIRSKDWAKLQSRNDALELGRSIWRDIFTFRRTPIVLTMGRKVEQEISKLLDATLIERVPVGWGNIQGAKYRFGNGWLVCFPHLSRYRIFGRAESATSIDFLLREAIRDCG